MSCGGARPFYPETRDLDREPEDPAIDEVRPIHDEIDARVSPIARTTRWRENTNFVSPTPQSLVRGQDRPVNAFCANCNCRCMALTLAW